MCLIVYSPEAKPLDRELFDRADTVNPDGIGVMSERGVQKFLGKKKRKRAWRYVNALAKAGVPFGVHFRWATHGDVTLDNVHPFTAPDGSHVMHNGVIMAVAASATAARSDTAVFVEDYMHYIPEPGEPDYEAQCLLFGAAIGLDSKLLILHARSKKFSIINEDAGSWRDGLWYSNELSWPLSWKPKRAYRKNSKPSFEGLPDGDRYCQHCSVPLFDNEDRYCRDCERLLPVAGDVVDCDECGRPTLRDAAVFLGTDGLAYLCAACAGLVDHDPSEGYLLPPTASA